MLKKFLNLGLYVLTRFLNSGSNVPKCLLIQILFLCPIFSAVFLLLICCPLHLTSLASSSVHDRYPHFLLLHHCHCFLLCRGCLLRRCHLLLRHRHLFLLFSLSGSFLVSRSFRTVVVVVVVVVVVFVAAVFVIRIFPCISIFLYLYFLQGRCCGCCWCCCCCCCGCCCCCECC